jgi:hypothetical protein
MKKITSEYFQAIFNLPWRVARDEGLFAEQGNRSLVQPQPRQAQRLNKP